MSLTKKQRKILDAIVFLIRRGEIPTVREVGALVGLRSPATVLKHLRALESEGLITTSGKSRGIRIADADLLADLLEDAGLLENAGFEGAEAEQGLSTVDEGGRREAADPADVAATGPHAAISERHAGTSSKDAERDALEKKEEEPDAPWPPSSGASLAGPSFHELDPAKLRAASTRSAYERVRETVTARGKILQAHFHRLSGSGGVPVAGAIAAGRPIETRSEAFAPGSSFEEQPSLALDPRMFAESGKLIALRIEGDSMVGAGILDGDFAIIRRQEEVEEGEIAAVLIDGEATLKRWHFRRPELARQGDANAVEDLLQKEEEREGKVRLVAANERFDPLEITEMDRKEVIVVGKYVGLVRGARMP